MPIFKLPLLLCRAWRPFIIALVLVSGTTTIGICADFADPAYRAAVEDASSPLTAERVEKDLWGLCAQDEHRIRFDGLGRVLMATWTEEEFDDKQGQTVVADDSMEIWMVPVDQVWDFFSENGREFSVRRLEQALGLPPNAGCTRMVTLWVHPSDLVRPCADPAVTDSLCEVDFPVGQAVNIDAAYKRWFTDRRATVYNCDAVDCYPWSGLGYTYDWGADASDNHVGFSEYLKPKGHVAKIVVNSVQDTETFFRNPVQE